MSATTASWHQLHQVVDRIGFTRRFISPYAIDPREAHGHPGLVAGRAGDAVEGDLQHQLRFDLAHWPEAVGGVVAHPLVEPAQLLVGEAEIGLADRRQLARAAVVAPAAERV